MSDLLDQIAKLSGLSPIFARTVVKRAVERAGVDGDSIRPVDVEPILPELERVLTVYLGAESAGERVEAIRRAFRHNT